MNCRIVILNYNGRELLEKCLPSIVEAARRSPYPCAVTVLDNQSRDASEAWVREHYPRVDYDKARENRVFCSYNPFVAAMTEDVAILLNNDIKVEPDFVAPLVKALEESPDVFFAAPRSKNFVTGEYEGSLSKMEMRRGMLWGSSRFPGHELKIAKPNRSMQCGFGAFRRSAFVELGGFEDLYLPGTVEDSDLAFRAWRRGWRGVYVPESVVFHMGQASFKKAFGSGGIRRLNRRNLYLFVWKNIRDARMLAEHLLWIPVHLVKHVVKGEWAELAAFGDALGRLPSALRKRKESIAEPAVRSDEEIFRLSREI